MLTPRKETFQSFNRNGNAWTQGIQFQTCDKISTVVKTRQNKTTVINIWNWCQLGQVIGDLCEVERWEKATSGRE